MKPVASLACAAAVLVVFGVLYVLLLTPQEVGDHREGGGRRCSVKDACLLTGGLKTPHSSRGKCIRSIQIGLLAIVGILCLWL